ncbi:PASTA domain-containing protein [Streptomyces sp. NPDC059629]|uniref:PASTA domain-containing protein n=1 Tax=Streptomyces sp. NPDC059629 TaxID=3346889 RepID=UPI0036CD8350
MGRRTLASAVAVTALLATVTACKATTSTGSNSSTAKAASSTGKGSTVTTTTVPNFVGLGLQSAQDTAQAAGFYILDSHDALGRDRNQIIDRDWKVCSQSVKPGSKESTDTKLNFGAVKVAETCPAKDQAAPSAASGSMPNFKGDSVKAARDALDPASITVKDAGGQGRFILAESNWQACSQTPAAGTKLAGQPVTLTAVKFDEPCP